MEFEKYLTELDSLEMSKLKNQNFEDKNLLPKKSMVVVSIFGGIIGVDRFMLGDKIKGIIKGVTFVSIFISLITILAIITKKVFDFYENTIGPTTITWADNVAIVGNGLANLMYAIIAFMVCYIAFAIFDGFLCYNKNMKRNYKLLQNQIK